MLKQVNTAQIRMGHEEIDAKTSESLIKNNQTNTPAGRGTAWESAWELFNFLRFIKVTNY